MADGAELDPLLTEPIKLRASRINGCAYGLDMHTKDALGETAPRIALLSAWAEAPCYPATERAVLRWCESRTGLPETGAPDSDYQELTANFTEKEVVPLTAIGVAINSWIRFAVGRRATVASYVSPRTPVAART